MTTRQKIHIDFFGGYAAGYLSRGAEEQVYAIRQGFAHWEVDPKSGSTRFVWECESCHRTPGKVGP